MHKRCSCGDMMPIKLRTVIYSGKVEIDNVPVYSCSSCNKSEVFPEAKLDLTGLIGKLGAKPVKQTYLFNEWNEWANLLVEAYHDRKRYDLAVVRRLTEDRINMLLDLYSVAKSLNDEAWLSDIHKRLGQLSRTVLQP
ncbi:YgiT-type zinc finger protein [Paenibacillus oenotherae]|uniref:YgiT-type zinc finger protein n=1 Tax=Paenibacillus oenotherae TaxID=1435645 RepID=A0ABS7D2P5_9BACL|nr:YgiT-type zinc finger protein [Paenibacillus oenotherae]MBW7474214.1 YgiT-type zinc finger protein [Paenibacillus oenotherae]